MKILFFGVLSEIAGCPAEDISFKGSVEELRTELIGRYPKMSDQRFQVAVNQKIVDNKGVLSGDEEVALLPPFTGG